MPSPKPISNALRIIPHCILGDLSVESSLQICQLMANLSHVSCDTLWMWTVPSQTRLFKLLVCQIVMLFWSVWILRGWGLSGRSGSQGDWLGLQGYSVAVPPIDFLLPDPATWEQAPAARAWMCTSYHASLPWWAVSLYPKPKKSFLSQLLLTTTVEVTNTHGMSSGYKMSASLA